MKLLARLIAEDDSSLTLCVCIHMFFSLLYKQDVLWKDGAGIARWIATVGTTLPAIHSTANACARAAGQVCIATKSVPLTITDRIVPNNVAAETVVAAIISPASATALPVTLGHCKFFFDLFNSLDCSETYCRLSFVYSDFNQLLGRYNWLLLLYYYYIFSEHAYKESKNKLLEANESKKFFFIFFVSKPLKIDTS